MKNILKNAFVLFFIISLCLSLVLTLIVNFKGIIGSLYESKEDLLTYDTSFSTISSAFSSNFVLLSDYSNIYGSIQRLQGKNAVWTSNADTACAIGDDGKLYEIHMYSNSDDKELKAENIETLSKCADSLSVFAKEISNRGEDIFFIQAPARYNFEYVTLPLPQTSTAPQRVEALYDLLENDENIDVINLQQRFKDNGVDFCSMFYKTDHHWTTKTAFLAYQEICKEINEKTDIHIDDTLFDLAQWNIYTRENCFVGSLGGKTGEGFIAKDDFDYIYPKFETKYKKTVALVPQQSISKGGSWGAEGEYTEAVLDFNKNPVRLGAYVAESVSEVIIENLMPGQDNKVLIFGDSFSLPVTAFLSTCFSETRLLDLRFFDDSVLDYIDDYKPDIVLVLYNPTSYNTNAFSFN